VYEGVSKSFRTGRLERELQMVQLSATRCSCIAIFVSQYSEFCCHNPLCCFSTSVCCLFRYGVSPETFGYTLLHMFETGSVHVKVVPDKVVLVWQGFPASSRSSCESCLRHVSSSVLIISYIGNEKSKITGHRLALLLRIRNFPVSKLDSETGCLKIGYDRRLPCH
jgi:hypothetical protein